jgi:hypothetical protein
MKRWSLLILALLVVALFAFAMHHASREREQQEHEAAYQSTLRSYSAVLKLGMSRTDVEGYLNAKKVRFSQGCCIVQYASAWDDLTKIGQEDSPWYCSEQNIYVAFQFAAVERPKLLRADASDTLTAVTIVRRFEGCL